mgnify:CR=1 FL=1
MKKIFDRYLLMVVRLVVLSADSLFKRTRVPFGSLPPNSTAKQVFTSLLNRPSITQFANFDINNINPKLNHLIDNGHVLDDTTYTDALNALALSTSSIIYIDNSNNIIVSSRNGKNNSPLLLYGEHSFNKNNISKISNLNSGIQRMFTSIRLNDVEYTDFDYVGKYGFRQKDITINHVVSRTILAQIGNSLLDEFKTPKMEMQVDIPSYVFQGHDLRDEIRIDYPYKLIKQSEFFPIVGQLQLNDPDACLPVIDSGFKITPNVKFKIISAQESIRNELITLKIRQDGITPGDGYV